MPLTNGDKAALGILAVAGAAIAGVTLYQKAKAPPPAESISISVSPASLPASGGNITITGKTTLPGGTSVGIYINGQEIDTFTTTGPTFTETYTVSPSSTPSPVTLSIYAET